MSITVLDVVEVVEGVVEGGVEGGVDVTDICYSEISTTGRLDCPRWEEPALLGTTLASSLSSTTRRAALSTSPSSHSHVSWPTVSGPTTRTVKRLVSGVRLV